MRRVGLFAGETVLLSEMPKARNADYDWGRALGRERLDTLLLNRANEAGATVWQPWFATQLDGRDGDHVCKIANKETGEKQELSTRVVIAAHGSWEPGHLPTQANRPSTRSSDLLGFKTHFRRSSLPVGLMPLLAFPGGYGGMVHTDHCRIALSCCIRRNELELCRRWMQDAPAADAVLVHIKKSCRGAREALDHAEPDGAWLSAGPIRPGIRRPIAEGVFCVGNAAGEAHPIIAEGISMAMQAAWLLCERLTAQRQPKLSRETLREIGQDYAVAWRSRFAARIRAAAMFAHFAIRPSAVALFLPIFRLFPAMLTLGARLSGKANEVVTPLEEAPAN